MSNRRPCGVVGGKDDFGGLGDFAGIGRESRQDRRDLVGMDAPHAKEPKVLAGPSGIQERCFWIGEVDSDVMDRDNAMSKTCGGQLCFRSDNDRVFKLVGGVHATVVKRAVVG